MLSDTCVINFTGLSDVMINYKVTWPLPIFNVYCTIKSDIPSIPTQNCFSSAIRVRQGDKTPNMAVKIDDEFSYHYKGVTIFG